MCDVSLGFCLPPPAEVRKSMRVSGRATSAAPGRPSSRREAQRPARASSPKAAPKLNYSKERTNRSLSPFLSLHSDGPIQDV